MKLGVGRARDGAGRELTQPCRRATPRAAPAPAPRRTQAKEAGEALANGSTGPNSFLRAVLEERWCKPQQEAAQRSPTAWEDAEPASEAAPPDSAPAEAEGRAVSGPGSEMGILGAGRRDSSSGGGGSGSGSHRDPMFLMADKLGSELSLGDRGGLQTDALWYTAVGQGGRGLCDRVASRGAVCRMTGLPAEAPGGGLPCRARGLYAPACACACIPAPGALGCDRRC